MWCFCYTANYDFSFNNGMSSEQYATTLWLMAGRRIRLLHLNHQHVIFLLTPKPIWKKRRASTKRQLKFEQRTDFQIKSDPCVALSREKKKRTFHHFISSWCLLILYIMEEGARSVQAGVCTLRGGKSDTDGFDPCRGCRWLLWQRPGLFAPQTHFQIV